MEIIQDFLNKDHRCRPGGNYNKLLITIHSTGNPYSTARGERNWLDNPTNTREASWHYVVDETEVIQAIPDNEEAWHCGDTNGKPRIDETRYLAEAYAFGKGIYGDDENGDSALDPDKIA